MNPKEIMRQNGKTFFLAARFLPSTIREDITILYTFCRFIDDLVDIKGESCHKILDDLETHQSMSPQVQQFLTMANKRKMSLEPAKILVSTLEKDRKGICLETHTALICYCYGVASTVGLMLCDIFGVQDKKALPFAIDLGIAMQLTNICRDIVEDAKEDKIYLPQECFKEPIIPQNIIQGTKDIEVLNVREQILTLADRYYQSADRGMHFLPRPVRLAILIASRLYQAKGTVIRQDSLLYLKKRADVPVLGKFYHTARGLYSYLFDPLYAKNQNIPHDATLHLDLAALPSAHS